MDEADVAKMQELADKVFADLGPPFSRNFAIPLLRPVVLDSNKFVEEFGEKGRDKPSGLSEDLAYIHWNPSFFPEDQEKSFIAAQMIMRSLEFHLVYTTEKGEEMWNHPSVLGFITGIAEDLQGWMTEQYGSEYSFLDFLQEPKEGFGKSRIGYDAYRSTRRFYHGNNWGGPFQREILRFVSSEEGGEVVFENIRKANKPIELAKYFLRKEIAALTQEQIHLKVAKKCYEQLKEYRTHGDQWDYVRDSMEEMEKNIRSASYVEVADSLNLLRSNFDKILMIDNPFSFEILSRKDKGYQFSEDELKSLRVYFEHFGEIMRKSRKMFNEHKKKGLIIYFSR